MLDRHDAQAFGGVNEVVSSDGKQKGLGLQWQSLTRAAVHASIDFLAQIGYIGIVSPISPDKPRQRAFKRKYFLEKPCLERVFLNHGDDAQPSCSQSIYRLDNRCRQIRNGTSPFLADPQFGRI